MNGPAFLLFSELSGQSIGQLEVRPFYWSVSGEGGVIMDEELLRHITGRNTDHRNTPGTGSRPNAQYTA